MVCHTWGISAYNTSSLTVMEFLFSIRSMRIANPDNVLYCRGKALENWARPSIDEIGVPTESWQQVNTLSSWLQSLGSINRIGMQQLEKKSLCWNGRPRRQGGRILKLRITKKEGKAE
jgi:hypothetical protein